MEAYPASFLPFPPEVDTAPNFSSCTSDNERETLKATNACNQKTRADIITMNAALSDFFLAILPKAICKTYEPICMKQPNTVFLHMFDWFINKYGKTTSKDCKENRQKMAADWHLYNGFEPLATHLFIGASYASAAHYLMNNHDVINIGLGVIKQCRMYSEEYKNWIAHKSETPAIVKMMDSFKEYWARSITLINQTSILAAQHGYSMAATDDNVLHMSYNESHANFGAAYAATQEMIKTQATSMAAMQGQLTNIRQFCMAVGQQPQPTIYAPTQQQHMSNNHCGRRNGGGHDGGSGRGNGGGGFPQQPTWFGGNGASAQQQSFPSTPYKHWENWSYCYTHGGDVDNAHMSATCGNCSPTHNPNANHANIMGGLIAGMHMTILPSAWGRKPPPPPPLPPAAAIPTATPTRYILPHPKYKCPTRVLWSNPTCRWHIPPADNHGHAGYSAWSNRDEFVGMQFPLSAGAAPMMQQPIQ
jgi:hypothetical protein